MAWIQTRCGRKWFPHSPYAELIDIDTIAVVLSRLPRFGGHTLQPYSVAQHSMWVAEHVQSPWLKLPALLHDAHEAYSGYGDVLRPVKLRFVKDIERAIDTAVAERFGFLPNMFQNPEVRDADLLALATEARDLMAPPPDEWEGLPEPHPERIQPIASQEYVQQAFLSCFRAYVRMFASYKEAGNGQGTAAAAEGTTKA